MTPRPIISTRTKIVCTLGPSSSSAGTLQAMIRAGMDVARFNFSHGRLSEHVRTLRTLRSVARKLGVPVSVVQDLQGPKIRIGDLSTPSVTVAARQQIVITTRNVIGNGPVFPTTYEQFHRDVKPGNRVLIDDGKIQLRVKAVRGRDVTLDVLVGGPILPHKGINLPGIRVSAPSLTERDKENLEFGFEHGVDYVALSFIRRAADVRSLREYMARHNPGAPTIPIIAKIEKGEAIAGIDEIIREADAVMVARGDLGVELPAEEVPLLQKTIARKCNEMGKPVIIATQMLESMIGNPLPTRAEASDVANAVLDGADAVMLSGETSTGMYPVETVSVMNRIIRSVEEHGSFLPRPDTQEFPGNHPYDPLCRSACLLAQKTHASAIVTLTHTGVTAVRLSKFRPAAQIIAVTPTESARHRLNLVWGIRGLIVENLKKDTDEAFRRVERRLIDEGSIHPGDTVVVLAGIPLFEGHPTNVIKVDVIPKRRR